MDGIGNIHDHVNGLMYGSCPVLYEMQSPKSTVVSNATFCLSYFECKLRSRSAAEMPLTISGEA
jgi:hypothetical protein